MEQKKTFSLAKLILPIFLGLFVISILCVSLIFTLPSIQNLGIPNVFTTIYDYSFNEGNSGRLVLQTFSNFIAYLFIIGAFAFGALSLFIIKKDYKLKLKAFCLSMLLIIPGTFGMVSGVFDFFSQGMGMLFATHDFPAVLVGILMILLFILDFFFYFLVVWYLIKCAKITESNEPVKEEKVEKAKPAVASVNKEEVAKVVLEQLNLDERLSEHDDLLLKEIRRIIREELDRLDRVAIVKETGLPRMPIQTEEIVEEEVVPAIEEVEDEEDNPKKGSAPRIPFAVKMVRAEKDLQEKYIELKNYILAYGASTRVSLGGDSFRIHRKTLVKITIVGKMLKVYYALDPQQFKDSTMPIVDVTNKVAYQDVPSCLKVKSSLSMKRAKELVDMVFKTEGVTEQKDVADDNHWIKELRDSLR